MLVLTRRIGEALLIGTDIKVTVERINGNQVKLSIEAPDDVHILREELADRLASVPTTGEGRRHPF